MKKVLFFSLCFLFFFTFCASAQLSLTDDYYIVSNVSSFNIAPISPANGSNLQQTGDNGNLSKWRLMSAGGDKYYIKQLTHGLYISAPAQGTKTAGKKLELVEHNTVNSTWRFEHQGNGVYRIKNVGNNFYIANLGSNANGASINQVLSPGTGANWKLTSASTETPVNTEISSPGTPMTTEKIYPPQILTASKTVGSANNVSQNVNFNYGYDVKLVYGSSENLAGGERKFLVLETRGTQGFNPGTPAETGTVNRGSKIRGYYIESIKTEARVVSGNNCSLYASLPKSDAQTGQTGTYQGFSIEVSGGGEAAGPTGSISIGYSFTKFSSLDWTDFKIIENNNSNQSTHDYKLSMLVTQAGGSKPYYSYTDLKNPNNLVARPLHILPSKATASFPLYEWIAFEAPANATGQVTIEIKAEMLVNFVKWDGVKVIQYPETITATKQFTVNLSDVGLVNP